MLMEAILPRSTLCTDFLLSAVAADQMCTRTVSRCVNQVVDEANVLIQLCALEHLFKLHQVNVKCGKCSASVCRPSAACPQLKRIGQDLRHPSWPSSGFLISKVVQSVQLSFCPRSKRLRLILRCLSQSRSSSTGRKACSGPRKHVLLVIACVIEDVSSRPASSTFLAFYDD
jgi:hypothetical protein